LLVGLIGVSSVLSGCGGSGTTRGSLSGKVTLDDKPLTAGTVIFSNKDASEVDRAPIQSDGSYKSDNVPLGDVRIAVLAPSEGPKMPPGAKLPTGIPADHPQAKMYAESGSGGFNIPKAYSDPATSNLTFKVEGGSQTYNIPLKSK
jgi:hypothetical protein